LFHGARHGFRVQSADKKKEYDKNIDWMRSEINEFVEVARINKSINMQTSSIDTKSLGVA